MKPAVFRSFDIRPLLVNGEEPFAAIRARVAGLAPDQGLTIIAPFVPAPLIELLQSEGFHSTMERRADGGWNVNFWSEVAG
jgi:hypothetical protein